MVAIVPPLIGRTALCPTPLLSGLAALELKPKKGTSCARSIPAGDQVPILIVFPLPLVSESSRFLA